MPETDAQTAAPLAPRPEVIDFLLTRRSRAARTLSPDRPDDATLETILAAGLRVPDHGMLLPWRIVQIERGAMPALAEAARSRMRALGQDEGAADKAAAQFGQGGVILAVVSCPRPSPKIPAWEQKLSAGAVCLTLVNAALALGWGANWLTGPLARDAAFTGPALGLGEGETVAGFIHLGRETVAPAERRRPDPAALVTRLA